MEPGDLQTFEGLLKNGFCFPSLIALLRAASPRAAVGGTMQPELPSAGFSLWIATSQGNEA